MLKQNTMLILAATFLLMLTLGFVGYWHMQKPVAVSVISSDSLPTEQGFIHRLPSSNQEDAVSLQQVLTSNTLTGTELGQMIEFDQHNQLIVNNKILSVVDYFLLATGEIPDELIYQAINQHLIQTLPEPALSQAKTIINNYLAMIVEQESLVAGELEGESRDMPEQIDAYGHWQQQGEVTDDILPQLQDSLQLIKDMRRKHLGGEVAGQLWGQDEEYDEFSLQKFTIMADKSLTPEQQQQQIEALIEQLPEDQRTDERLQIDQQQQLEQLKVAGVDNSPEQYQQNMLSFGVDAADRLSQLAIDRQVFSQQYQDYQYQLGQLKQQGLADDEFELQRDQLRLQFFPASQYKRVAALDRQRAAL